MHAGQIHVARLYMNGVVTPNMPVTDPAPIVVEPPKPQGDPPPTPVPPPIEPPPPPAQV